MLNHVDSYYIFPAVVARRTHFGGWPRTANYCTEDADAPLCQRISFQIFRPPTLSVSSKDSVPWDPSRQLSAAAVGQMPATSSDERASSPLKKKLSKKESKKDVDDKE